MNYSGKKDRRVLWKSDGRKEGEKGRERDRSGNSAARIIGKCELEYSGNVRRVAQ